MADNIHPKVFISYSWTSREYEKKVRELATRLRRNGVDVILDQWDLKYGQDMNFFMENSIRNSVKVLILCDERYVRKADTRNGGVGKETYIITPKVYDNYDQEKFIPVLMEQTVSPPDYIKSRYAVSFTNADEDEYENLLRAIYSKPKNEKPEIGDAPEWLNSNGGSNSGGGPGVKTVAELQKPETNKTLKKPELGEIPSWTDVEEETKEAEQLSGTIIKPERAKPTSTSTKTVDTGLPFDIGDVYRHIKKGDRNVSFGVYPYGRDGKVEPLLWRVLDVKDGKALLITEKLIDCQPYNESYTDVTWESCSLRRWMNEDFVSAAFDEEERALIAETVNENRDNERYGTEGGKETSDRVFALGIDEVENKGYFEDNEDRMAAVTPYAKKRGSWTRSDYKLRNGEETSWWWLRSPGDSSDYAACVHDGGDVHERGCNVTGSSVSVRPALWLHL